MTDPECVNDALSASWAEQGPISERFRQHVNKTETCWLWEGATANGYGRFKVNGRVLQAHRVAYEWLVGPIPDGLQIDHLCRVRRCVNPSHMEPVTRRENIIRGIGITAINAKKERCVRGHAFDEANTRWQNGERSCHLCILRWHIVRPRFLPTTPHGEKDCRLCGQRKACTEFPLNNLRLDGLDALCTACKRNTRQARRHLISHKT